MPSTTYRWQVASRFEDERQVGEERAFSTRELPPDPPAAVSLTRPAPDASTGSRDLKLCWQSDDGDGTYFDLYVWPRSLGVELPLTPAIRGLSLTCHRLRGALFPGDYLWDVVASNAGGRSPRAGPGRFTVLREPRFLRGDCDGTGVLNITDPIRSLEHLFLGGEAPDCLVSCDANADGSVNIADPIFVLGFLFLGSEAIPAPYPGCGHDEIPTSLSCKAEPVVCR